MTTQEEYFQQHAVEGQLSEEQMATMLTLPAAGGQGDSVTHVVRDDGQPEPSSTSTTSTTTTTGDGGSNSGTDNGTAQPGAGGEPDLSGLNRDNAVILARDGKHTISFDRLEEARTRAKAEADARAAAEATAARLQAEIEALRAATAGAAPATTTAAAPAAATTTTATAADPAQQLLEGVDFGDYSDEAIARGIAQAVTKAVAPLQSELAALKAGGGATTTTDTVDPVKAHYDAIYKAHADADSIPDSQEYQAWLATQPKVAQAAYRAALEGGTTDEIIEVFSTYKAATGRTGTETTAKADDPVAAAAAAVANATTRTPSSLTDLPAGTTAHHSEADAMLEKSSLQLMQSFEGKDPREIMAAMNRIL